MLDYWHEWPPFHELMRGYVGYKPLSKEEMARRDKAGTQAAKQTFGKAVSEDHLPQWLQDAHKQKKQTTPLTGG